MINKKRNILSIYILFLIGGLLFPNYSIAKNEFIITDSSNTFEINASYFLFFEDYSKEKTIENIINDSANFSKVDQSSYFPTIKNFYSASWFKVVLWNKSKKDKQWVIENLDAHINSFDIFIVRQDKSYDEYNTGFGMPFNTREYYHKNFIFNPLISANEKITIYIRGVSFDKNPIILKIQTHEQLLKYATTEYYYLGIFYGILIIIGFYNFLVLIALREKTYLFYFIYVVSTIIVSLMGDGLGFQYLWPNHPFINEIFSRLGLLIMFIAFFLYSKSFLEYKKKLPVLNSILNITTIIVIIFNLTGAFYIIPQFSISFFIPYTIIYIGAIVLSYKRNKNAWYFILAYSLFYLGILFQVLRLLKWYTVETIFTVYSMNFGQIVEIIILTFAMAERLYQIKVDRANALLKKEEAQNEIIKQLKINEELKEKVNNELEQKIKARTIELNEKNEQLAQMAEEVTKMNLALDKQNYSLKSQVEDSLKKRVTFQKADLEDFIKIFPGDDSCYRYLSDLKWGKNFECRKCKSSDFTNGPSFSRTCSICNTNESATDYTIFKGIRIPLYKAFYILYLTTTNNKISTYDLEKQVDLRQKTCWKFKTKITEVITNVSKKRKSKEPITWDTIILD